MTVGKCTGSVSDTNHTLVWTKFIIIMIIISEKFIPMIITYFGWQAITMDMEGLY